MFRLLENERGELKNQRLAAAHWQDAGGVAGPAFFSIANGV
jgi:hypothetical protein